MKYWLMKSEPNCYSIDDLKRDKVEMWDGVRNYQARNMIRDNMRKGDLALFYHSNTEHIGVVGVMEIAAEAYPDPTQFDPKSEHPDLSSDPEKPRWFCVDVRFKEKFLGVVTLQDIRQNQSTKNMVVAKKGNRLSITPVKKSEFNKILTLAKTL